MRKLKRRLMALFTVLIMLLNTGGIYADGHELTDINVVENQEESVELVTENPIEGAEEVVDDKEVIEEPGEIEDNPVGENQEDKEENPVEENQEEKEDNLVEENQEGKEDNLVEENQEEKEEDKEEEAVEENQEEGPEEQELEGLAEEGPVTLDAEVNGVRITVSAGAGVLPQDAGLSVNPISEDNAHNYTRQIMENTRISLGEFIAFDINILDNNGLKIQPNGLVDVRFSGLDFISNAKETVVYHLESNDANEQEYNLYSRRNSFFNTADDIRINEMLAQSYGNEVSFSTDHFSIYGIGTVATATYEFYNDVDVNSALVDTQIVLNGEKLEEPETPEKQAGKRFIGWYLVGETNPINFGVPVAVSPGTGSGLEPRNIYRVEARYEDVFYVYFLYNDNVILTKEVAPAGRTNDAGVPIVVTEAGKALIHWSTTENGEAFNFNNEITADTPLYAVLGDRWKVTFDTQGGDSILPKYIENNQPLGIVDTPVRAGYTFQKWSANANGTGPSYTSSTAINSDIKLYAIWAAKQVNYSIIYWLENADDTLHTYKETVIATGIAGMAITLQNSQRASGRYNYFTYDKYDMGKTINGDGTTIVNVYYSRNSYKVEFNLNRETSKLKIGGQTYNHPTKYYFTAKYESDISNLWPTATNIDDVTTGSGRNKETYQFYGWTTDGSETTFVSKRLKLTSDLISTSGTKFFTGSWRTDLSMHTLHYMIESLTSSGEKQYGSGNNKKWYSEDMAYSQKANSTGNWSAKQLPGVTNVGKESGSGKHEYFYYDRLSYDLNFFNPTDKLDRTHKLKYGSSINDKNYTPTRPAGISADYVFMGWYSNPEGQGNQFNFTNATMPENNLVLYAKWAPPKYQVKYYETEDEDIGKLKTIDNIPGGSTISVNDLNRITPDGLNESAFRDWYWYLSGAFVPYDFNTPIHRNDIVLYPVWNKSSYTVTYKANGATGTVPKDNNNYYKNAKASVLAPVGLIAPENLVFIGWKDDLGKVYYPNDKLIITGEMTLTAQWGHVVPDTTLTYKANGGVGEDVVDTLRNNDVHTVRANTFTFTGHEFEKWNTKADGTGDDFDPGNDIIVGNSNPVPNILYAIWKVKTHQIKYISSGNGTISGITPQTVPHQGNTTKVTAVPAEGYYFVGWDDGNSNPERQEINVTTNATYTATFAKKIVLTVTANSDTKVYNGALQTVTGHTPTGLQSGHILSGITASGSGTNVGSYDVVFSGTPVIMDGTRNVTNNYAISLVKGKLVITAAQLAVSVTANSDIRVYTGSEQMVSGYKSPIGLLENHVLTGIVANGFGTDVGSYDVTFVGTPVIMNGSVDVTQNYNITLVKGKLEITPSEIAISVTANSGSKVYTGLEQKVEGYEMPVGLLAGHTLSGITASGAGTNVGNYPVTFTGTPVIMDGVVDVTANYGIMLLPGNLEITAGEIAVSVTANSGTKVYTGLEQKVEGYEVPVGLLAGHTLSGIAASGAGTNVGNYPVTFIGSPVIMDGLVDVTQNYNVTLLPGNLEITVGEIALEVTANSGIRVYDGTLQTITGYTITSGLLSGHVLSGITVSGSGTDVGNYDVTFTGTPIIEDADGVDVTENYGVTQIPGNLFIWKSELTVEKSADKETFLAVGEKIIYSYKIANTGNVTLEGPFTLVDDKIDQIDMSGAPVILAPDADFTVMGEYLITQADFDAGFVTNLVKVTGTFEEEDVPGEDELTVPVDPEAQKPELGVKKSADKEEFIAVGEVITYTYLVTNTGNVTLEGPFSLEDDKIGSIDMDSPATLAPGGIYSATAEYEVTQADMDAGFVTNLVIARGIFGEDGVTGEDSVTVPANPPAPPTPPTPPTPTPPTPTPPTPTPPTPNPPAEELVEIVDEDIPLGIVNLEEDTEPVSDEFIIIEDDVIPLGIVPEEVTIEDDLIPRGKLPKTGAMPAGVFYGFGTLLVAAGVVVKKKKRRK